MYNNTWECSPEVCGDEASDWLNSNPLPPFSPSFFSCILSLSSLLPFSLPFLPSYFLHPLIFQRVPLWWFWRFWTCSRSSKFPVWETRTMIFGFADLQICGFVDLWIAHLHIVWICRFREIWIFPTPNLQIGNSRYSNVGFPTFYDSKFKLGVEFS